MFRSRVFKEEMTGGKKHGKLVTMTEDDVRWQRRKQRCIYKNIIKLKEGAFIGCLLGWRRAWRTGGSRGACRGQEAAGRSERLQLSTSSAYPDNHPPISSCRTKLTTAETKQRHPVTGRSFLNVTHYNVSNSGKMFACVWRPVCCDFRHLHQHITDHWVFDE